jgi:hypothetical protein
LGNFNLLDIDWQVGTAGSRASGNIVEAAAAAGLHHFVDFPTHTRGKVLDLIITNIPERLANIREEARIGRSDHAVVHCDLQINRNHCNKIKVKNWNKPDCSVVDPDPDQ